MKMEQGKNGGGGGARAHAGAFVKWEEEEESGIFEKFLGNRIAFVMMFRLVKRRGGMQLLNGLRLS